MHEPGETTHNYIPEAATVLRNHERHEGQERETRNRNSTAEPRKARRGTKEQRTTSLSAKTLRNHERHEGQERERRNRKCTAEPRKRPKSAESCDRGAALDSTISAGCRSDARDSRFIFCISRLSKNFAARGHAPGDEFKAITESYRQDTHGFPSRLPAGGTAGHLLTRSREELPTHAKPPGCLDNSAQKLPAHAKPRRSRRTAGDF